MDYLSLHGVCHHYEKKPSLNQIHLSLQKGEIGCLMGPSGSGKSTVLLCIAGLEHISGGSITLDGATISQPRRHLSPEKRGIGMVFQDFALFPHLNVFDNVAFGLYHAPPATVARTTHEMLELCDIANLQQAYPHELSGGEQQRVALARALATHPKLLLLDEPLSKLDPALHEKISRQLRDILKAKAQTTLVVTHNQNEAFLMSDSGGVINGGAICQWDKIDNLYHHPNCAFVAEFVGEGFLLSATIAANKSVKNILGHLGHYAEQDYPLIQMGDKVKVLLRPNNITLSPATPANSTDTTNNANKVAQNQPQAVITRRIFRGATTHYQLRLPNDEQIISVMPSNLAFNLGDTVAVAAQVPQLTLFPAV